MKRCQHGFTLIEITAVLVLMAIISAYVIGRSIGTEQIDLAGQTDKIRNQIRYAQSTGMKRSDADEIWGIKFDPGTDQYWLFFASIPVDPGEPDLADQQVTFPGEQNKKVSAADFGVDINPLVPSVLFFDRLGKPYKQYVDTTDNDELDAPLTITLSASGQNRTIRVIPETGLVQ
ncbi:MAG: type II secretion system protein [Desulfobacterales bacterium]|jgi:prepilin-type N-terminal cleavage/methylation domain-containing protein